MKRNLQNAPQQTNGDLSGDALQQFAKPDQAGTALLAKVAERFGLSARGYHRVQRVARTIADLEGCKTVGKHHVAEAVSFRLPFTHEV